jgi:hypothetical protein
MAEHLRKWIGRQSFASVAVLLLAPLFLTGCRATHVYHTYSLGRLPQLEKLFSDLKDKKLKRILLKTLLVQKIRVRVHDSATKRISVYRSYDMSPDLLLDAREYRVELPYGEQKYQQCLIRDEQNWVCDQFTSTQLEMRSGQLYVAGIQLEKKTTWLPEFD